MSSTASVVRTTHASGLHSVERSLEALHTEMLRSAADDAGQVRLCVLNFVAACIEDSDAELATRVLTSIGARHPARVIVVRAHPEAGDSAIEADVSLQRTAIGAHEIYTELMRLDVRGEPAFHLSSIVTPLLVPDIPSDLWVVGSPRLVQAFSDDAVALCDRIILDSGAYPDPREPLGLIAAEFARRGDELVIGDIAWEGIRVWRELIAQAFDAPGAAGWLAHVRELRIASSGNHAPAQAWLLAGWMASRLGWERGAEPVSMRVEGDPNAPAVLRTVTLRLSRDGDDRTLKLEAQGGALCVMSEVGGHTVTRTVPHEEPDMIHLMSQLMDESREDRIYPASVQRAAALRP